MLVDPPVPGAVAGQHTVTITTATISGNDAARPVGERVPPAWRDRSQVFDVPLEGTAAADFELGDR